MAGRLRSSSSPIRPLPTHRPFFASTELEAVADVLESRWIGKGAVTEEFEGAIREIVGARHVLSTSSGTAALHMALDVLDLRPGDEILVPSLTYAAPVTMIVVAGARPVFCDVREETFNIDVDDAIERASDRTRAIMPVHYGGLPCDMDAILDATRSKGWTVIEDAAHAFGSSHRGRPIGSLSDITCFSFDPIKNITSGTGGAICTDDDELARRLLPLRNVGIDFGTWRRIGDDSPWHYHVVTHGWRYELHNLNAALGLAQLRRLEAFRARKHQIVRQYDEAFSKIDAITLPHRDLDSTFPFSYVVRVTDGNRDRLMRHLKDRQVDCTIQFYPNHLQPAFAEFHELLPVTDKLKDEIVTLPLFFEMTEDDVALVIDSVRSFWSDA
jgi:perosamine synthetase